MIAPRWFLTAAHCGDHGVPRSISLNPDNTGLVDLIAPHSFANVDVWIPHSQYAGPPSYANDIALVHVAPYVFHSGGGEYPGIVPPEPIALATAPASTAGGIGDVSFAGFGPTADGELPDYFVQATAVPTHPASACASSYGRAIDPARELCFGNADQNVCGIDAGGPVVAGAGANARLVGVISTELAPPACGTKPALAAYVPGYAGWIAQYVDGGDSAGPIELSWELPPPSLQGFASGVSNVQGWAYSKVGTITSVRVLGQDGTSLLTVPCCSERGDVKDTFPEAPLLSGFAAAINWANLTSAQTALTLVVRDSAGNERRELRVVKRVRLAGDVTFARGLVFTDATSCTLGEESGRAIVTCSNIEYDVGSCAGTVTLAWSDDKQAFEILRGCQ